MEQMFAPVSQRRKSPLGVAVSGMLHVALGFAAFAVADLGAFEAPRPASTSLTFVVAPSAMPDLQLQIERPVQVVRESPVNPRPVDTPVPEPRAPGPASPVPPVPIPVEAPHVDAAPLMPAAMLEGAVAVATPTLPPAVVNVGGFNFVRTTGASRERTATQVAAVQLLSVHAPNAIQRAGTEAVHSGDFDVKPASPRTAQGLASSDPAPGTAMEILFKPDPEYTDEAKALRIQGDVILEVEFGAAEEIHVLRVVRSLGHGLDETAARAAVRIRFKPAQRGGRPVDVRTLVHIVFRLA